MLMLDLDELKSVFAKRWFWSTDSMSLVRFRQSDRLKSHSHLGELRQRAAAVLAENGISQPLSSVRLLTQLRYLGFEMNPVCFYYCYVDAEPESARLSSSTTPDDKSAKQTEPTIAAERVIAIIAEVNNTPWGEQHNYVIRADEAAEQQSNIKSLPIDKTFHVSPFMGMNMNYRMAFSLPGEKLGVTIENHLLEDDADEPNEIPAPKSSVETNGADRDKKKILEVAMLLDRIPLSGTNLNWMLIKYPLISFKTFAAIYFQALRLYLKKVPFFTHPKDLSPAGLASVETELADPNPTASSSAMVGR